ncbi:hypothetical protein HZH66_001637 [Vespula vulgaris]|uniref:Uncharacterized protein n=1 Tax=Vespula vulgaris TaxID=7454 RepID=A0A834KZ05_VESVU|nr:hypothetical protein HZH66_001637 [Vespula vulgaris]
MGLKEQGEVTKEKGKGMDGRILFLKVTPKKVSQRGPRGDNIFKQQILSSDNFKSPFSILEFVRSDLQNLIMPFLNLNWTIR